VVRKSSNSVFLSGTDASFSDFSEFVESNFFESFSDLFIFLGSGFKIGMWGSFNFFVVPI
jgi:hypothetical protein